MFVLKLFVIVAALWCACALIFLFHVSRSFGKRQLFSQAAGDPMAGVRYAFTKGLMPRAKESVREHPITWALGVAFHLGIFAAFAALVTTLNGLTLPLPYLRISQAILLLGALSGSSLLIKRMVVEHLRGLSVPDDFLSSALTIAFCWLALLSAFFYTAQIWFLAEAALLLLYAPLGKIRHCLFFFPTRFHFGAVFGRRGVFPPASPKA